MKLSIIVMLALLLSPSLIATEDLEVAGGLWHIKVFVGGTKLRDTDAKCQLIRQKDGSGFVFHSLKNYGTRIEAKLYKGDE